MASRSENQFICLVLLCTYLSNQSIARVRTFHPVHYRDVTRDLTICNVADAVRSGFDERDSLVPSDAHSKKAESLINMIGFRCRDAICRLVSESS
jgi:hypothetical protein